MEKINLLRDTLKKNFQELQHRRLYLNFPIIHPHTISGNNSTFYMLNSRRLRELTPSGLVPCFINDIFNLLASMLLPKKHFPWVGI